MSLGENINRLRRDKGWTQVQLSKHTGIKVGHISKLERGEAEDMKISTLYKLMNAFGCSADTLLMDTEKVGTEGLLRMQFERAEQLPDHNKKIIIDLIDKYCIAAGLQNAFSPENRIPLFGSGYIDKAPKEVLKQEK